MPRPSSGWAVPLKGDPLGVVNDRYLNLLTLPPSKFFECQQEALQLLPEEYRDSSFMIHVTAESIAWHRYGTSYIVDELIGGPWD